MRTPNFPKPASKTAIALATMLSGQCLTARRVFQTHGNFRLADSVFKLRRLGWCINNTELVSLDSHDRIIYFDSYDIDPWQIAELGERGSQFLHDTRVEFNLHTSVNLHEGMDDIQSGIPF